ncbi:MAG: MFS transporter [Anaerolineae bacterium]|nr:MFS transporter [Anaerolineae bacterium]MDW8099802.1 MFS transporter [Anaerolineae bacterium]
MMDKSPAANLAFVTAHLGSRRGLIVLYMAAVFLYWMALYLYVPTLPIYAQSKADDLALVGVALSMYGLWQAIIRLPLGIAADWLGWRKPFIIAGFALAGLGAWMMGTATDIQGVILGRAITGLAAGTWAPLVVVFSSLFPPEEAVRASALLTSIGSVGRMLATAVTGSLNELGGYSLAFFLAAIAAALAIVTVLPSQEQRRPPKPPSVRGVGRLIIRRDVLLPSLLSAVNQYATWATTFGFLPIIASQLGATGVTQSILVTMNIAVVTLGNLMVTTLIRVMGTRRLVHLSFWLIAIGTGSAALAPSLPMVFLAQLCLGLSQGIGYPVLMGMSIQNVADAERTTAMGLHQSVYAIGMFTGPWLSGILADVMGIRPMFGVTAFACLALGLYGTGQLRKASR